MTLAPRRALASLLTVGLFACTGSAPSDHVDTDTTADTDVVDTVPVDTDVAPSDTDVAALHFFVVVVSDAAAFPGDDVNACSASAAGSHGADIDAVDVEGPPVHGTRPGLGNLVSAQANLGTTCTVADSFDDPAQAEGAPDGDKNLGFLSLGGGTLAGKLTGDSEIVVGSEVIVYEIGLAQQQTNEAYGVWLATTVECGLALDPSCTRFLGNGSGETTFAVTAP